MKSRTLLIVSTVCIAGIFASQNVRSSDKKQGELVGTWAVTQQPSGDFRSHSYEFRTDGICIEKANVYQVQSVSIAGFRDQLSKYRYQHLGGQRYRLKELTTTFDGRPPAAWPLETHDYVIEIHGDRAISYGAAAAPASDTFWAFLWELRLIRRMPRAGEEHWERQRRLRCGDS